MPDLEKFAAAPVKGLRGATCRRLSWRASGI